MLPVRKVSLNNDGLVCSLGCTVICYVAQVASGLYFFCFSLSSDGATGPYIMASHMVNGYNWKGSLNLQACVFHHSQHS